MKITIPDPSAVVLIGASGAGKSTFARRHFRETEVLSSDWARGMVCDDPNSLTVNDDAFDVVHFLMGKRLANLRLCVIDATNVQRGARAPLVKIAREHHMLPVAIVLDVPERVCRERNAARAERADMPDHVVRRHRRDLRRSLRHLRREGFRIVHVLDSVEAIEAVTIERRPLFSDLRSETGPFDIVGDVHGCYDELCELLDALGYEVREPDPSARWNPPHYGMAIEAPDERRLCFMGDLVDRGPRTPDVLRLVMSATASGVALCVPGNHDVKLSKALRGRNVKIAHGLQASLDQLADVPDAFRDAVVEFIESLISHFVLDGGALCVAHAGMRADYQRRASGRVREFALYGDTTGEVDEMGLPVRLDWAAEYRGDAMVVYGHTPVYEPRWLNDTICIDTGCVFGHRLTALRYPERELVSVEAHARYVEPLRPLHDEDDAGLGDEALVDGLLHIDDVRGKHTISTRLRSRITIRRQNAAAALEVMSRYAVDPRWLVYLPPTMAPSATSTHDGLLEHPDEALAYYRKAGVEEIVCEEKHMGSRAVVVVCRDADVARRRFGVSDGRLGRVYTRTGRPFFDDDGIETAVLERVRDAAADSGLIDELAPAAEHWLCLDCELMPWSAKARALLVNQYARVGAAARGALEGAVGALEKAAARGMECGPLLEKMRGRKADAERFTEAYREYCWSVNSVDDLRLAPFHVLAVGDSILTDRDHVWHMETAARLAAADASELLVATEYRVVGLSQAAACADAVAWWETMTADGGEGFVVKPRDFLVKGSRGLIQPALKCRGREYLRIIYGPSYTEPQNLQRLRKRSLRRKRGLALAELALGLEALERFVARRPLRSVHACVFGVLALESEPVDPRL